MVNYLSMVLATLLYFQSFALGNSTDIYVESWKKGSTQIHEEKFHISLRCDENGGRFEKLIRDSDGRERYRLLVKPAEVELEKCDEQGALGFWVYLYDVELDPKKDLLHPIDDIQDFGGKDFPGFFMIGTQDCSGEDCGDAVGLWETRTIKVEEFYCLIRAGSAHYTSSRLQSLSLEVRFVNNLEALKPPPPPEWEDPEPAVLIPCSEPGSWSRPYRERLKEALAVDFSDPAEPAAQMLVVPAWEDPEYVVTMSWPIHAEKAVLVATRAKDNVYSANHRPFKEHAGREWRTRPAQVGVTSWKAEVGIASWEIIYGAFVRSILSARFIENEPLVLHGTSYEFRAYLVGSGVKCVELSRPDTEHPLVQLGKAMIDYAKAEASQRELALEQLLLAAHQVP